MRRSVARGLQTQHHFDGDEEFLLPLLDDVDPEVRAEAIVAATRTQDSGVEARVRAMAKRDRDLQLRDLAGEAVRLRTVPRPR